MIQQLAEGAAEDPRRPAGVRHSLDAAHETRGRRRPWAVGDFPLPWGCTAPLPSPAPPAYLLICANSRTMIKQGSPHDCPSAPRSLLSRHLHMVHVQARFRPAIAEQPPPSGPSLRICCYFGVGARRGASMRAMHGQMQPG